MKSGIASVIVLALTGSGAQDVPKLRKEKGSAEVQVGRDRLDLRLSPPGLPTLSDEDRKRASLGFRSDIDADFACGRFDMKASFQSIFSKHVREEFLEASLGKLESMFVGNAMELVCETSPTLCQLIQHYRMATNAMLTMEFDRCQAIEGAIDTAQKRIAASALKSCMEAKAAEGVPLDEARRQCQQSDSVRGLMGEKVAKFDLVEELTKQFGLRPDDAKALKDAGQDLTYDGRRIAGSADAAAMTRRYDELRAGYVEAWREALDGLSRAEMPSKELAARLMPQGGPLVTARELEEIAALPAADRTAIVASIAGASALLAFTEEIHRVERILEAAQQLPKVDRDELRERLARLRTERARLTERFEQETRLRKALLDAAGAAADGARRRVGEVLADRGLARYAEDYRLGTRAFGQEPMEPQAKRNVAQTMPRGGGACESACGGGVEYSFGGSRTPCE